MITEVDNMRNQITILQKENGSLKSKLENQICSKCLSSSSSIEDSGNYLFDDDYD